MKYHLSLSLPIKMNLVFNQNFISQENGNDSTNETFKDQTKKNTKSS